MQEQDKEPPSRAAFETLFAAIHYAGKSPATRLFERVSDDRRYCSMEVEYAWLTYCAMTPTPAVDLSGLTHKFEEIRSLLEEAYGFKSTSPVAQRNINDALGLLTEIEVLSAPVVREGKMTDGWLPTAANVNALPEGVRRYVHDLESRCDPAGDVAALTGLRDQLDGVQLMYRKAADALEEVRGCFEAAEAEGLSTVLAETTDERLKDLVERRLMYAFQAAGQVEREVLATGKQDAEPVPTTAIYSSELATEGYRPFGPGEPLLPERDPSKPAEQQGLFRKFEVRRVDGSDQPGGKHEGCRYFVLDLNHDQHAPAAMRAYAVACESTHPQLAADLKAEFGEATPCTPSQAWEGELPELPMQDKSEWPGTRYYTDHTMQAYARKAIGAAVAGVRDAALEDAAALAETLAIPALFSVKMARYTISGAIRSLSSNPVSLTEKDGWISVEERLPNQLRGVLVCHETNTDGVPDLSVAEGRLDPDGCWRVAATFYRMSGKPSKFELRETVAKVLYWKPLPEAAPHPASNGNGEKGGANG